MLLKSTTTQEEAFAKLHTAVAQWVDLTETQWQQLAAIFKPRQAEVRQFIVLPGATQHEVMFVTQGLLRFYYVGEDGKETNKAFIAENEFAGPLASASLNLPLYFGIQALEETHMLVAQYDDYVNLYEQDLIFERLGRKLTETLLIRKELRTRSLLMQNAKERYLNFLETYPNLVDRIPQYQLASYLGITEVSLSRLKNS